MWYTCFVVTINICELANFKASAVPGYNLHGHLIVIKCGPYLHKHILNEMAYICTKS